MFIYFLKMIACSAAFYALYALVFQKEKMLVFNRFYLLAALVVSFLIPLITITIKVLAVAVTDNLQFLTSEPVPYSPVAKVSSSFESVVSWQNMLSGILIVISLFILVRLVVNLLRIRNMFSVSFKNIKYESEYFHGRIFCTSLTYY